MRKRQQAKRVSTFPSQLQQLLAGREHEHPSEVFRDITDDDFWWWVNTAGRETSPALQAMLPGLPDPKVQRRWTGKVGAETQLEAFAIYQAMRDLHTRHFGSLRERGPILDFGCGWGRVIRYFLKDVGPGQLMGTDYDEPNVEFCVASNPWCSFARNEAGPPLPIADDSVGFIYAYSVFSHFSEPMHQQWLDEFRRVLRPGGALALTVRPRSFLDYCRRSQAGEETGARPMVQRAFPDAASVMAEYDEGAFCFSPYDPSDAGAWWGEACIPRAYIDAHWTKQFDLVDFDGAPELKQHVVLLRA